MIATTQETQRIDNLKKITAKCKAGTVPGGNDVALGDEPFDFIFGIASEGLTPFEFMLGDKTVGDRVEFILDSKDVCKTFQHLEIPGMDLPSAGGNIYFTFDIKDVSSTDNREVIKAMAGLNACEGGSCDCCGGH